MSYLQAITPTPSIAAEEGMCLQYVRQTFGLPARYGSATEAWQNSPTQHRDRDYPSGVWFPVWWALDKNVNGHVALVSPDGRVYSTSNLNPNPLKVHPNVADVEAYYARYGMTLTYRGWTEDVAGTPVITTSTIAAQGEIITPQEDEMTPQQMQELKLFIQGDNEARHVVTRSAVNDARDSVNFNTQKQVEAVGRVTQQLILDNASAADIAAAVPANIVQDVLDGLAKRLVK
jgi:hypothetical protein